MSRFEDNIIKAITTSDVVLLKNTLKSSERIIEWNQTLDGLSVLALCVKFFHPEIFEALYRPSNHTLTDGIFSYMVEHAPKVVVDTFASNIIATINYKLANNDIWEDVSDASQILKMLQNATHHINFLINHQSCNLIDDLLNSKTGARYLSLLLIKSIEWDNQKLLSHAIEQIQQKDRLNWCDLSYRGWNTANIQHVCRVYAAQSHPNLNAFLDQVSPQTWCSPQKSHHSVLLYSPQALKDLLNDGCTKSKQFVQNAPQNALQRLSDEDVLKELTAPELEVLLNAGEGCTIEQYEFLSQTPIRFEIPLILEQYRRIYASKKDVSWSQKQDKELLRFQRFCAPMLRIIPYAFQEKRMDLELYYKSVHGASPNQSVSVLDCLRPEDRAWVEKCLLHEHINDSGSKVIKKSKI